MEPSFRKRAAKVARGRLTSRTGDASGRGLGLSELNGSLRVGLPVGEQLAFAAPLDLRLEGGVGDPPFVLEKPLDPSKERFDGFSIHIGRNPDVRGQHSLTWPDFPKMDVVKRRWRETLFHPRGHDLGIQTGG
jgi:hypothetical protein